jgi:hypothetical protein
MPERGLKCKRASVYKHGVASTPRRGVIPDLHPLIRRKEKGELLCTRSKRIRPPFGRNLAPAAATAGVAVEI